jgi:hypothetical protein
LSIADEAQPAPTPSSGPFAWDEVRQDIIQTKKFDREPWRTMLAEMSDRDAFGLEKHGERLAPENGRDHLADAWQETLDQLVYMRAAIMSLGDNHEMRRRLNAIYWRSLDVAASLREFIAEGGR